MPTHDCDTLEERERAEIAGNEPGAQEEHADALEVLTYLPAGQEAQFVAADELEYVPAPQSTHTGCNFQTRLIVTTAYRVAP